KNCLTFAGVRFGLAGSKGKMLRTAATTPAMTGQAAEVPLSGSPLPNASDPRKCVYAAISGLLLNRVPGPRLEYPTKVWFVSTPATQMTSGCEFAPVIVRAPGTKGKHRPSGQAGPQFPAANTISAPAALRLWTMMLKG